MSEQKTDRAMVDEARRIVEGIVVHQKNSEQRLSQFEKQVDDMKKAQRLLTEAVTTVPIPAFGGESRLRSFLNDDGSMQWTSETKAIKVAGRGTINTQMPGLLDSTPANDWHADLQKIAAKRAFARMIMSAPHTPKTDLELYKHLERAPTSIAPAVQRAFYDTAGKGAEWIPDEFVPDLYETFQVPRGLRALFPEVPVDRNTILIPRLSRGGRPYKKGSVATDTPAAYTASTVQTAQKSISIKGLAVRYEIDDAAAEDSAIALMPTLGRQIAQDLEDGFEDCMLNGDTQSTHEDAIATWNIRSRWGGSGLGSASDHRRLFDGFRRQSFARSTTSSGGGTALTTAKLIVCLGKMGEMAAQRQILVCSPEFMTAQLMGITDLQTIDKIGPQATLLTGQVAQIMGIPVIMSRFMGADLAATGLFTGSGTLTGACIVNRESYNIYNRRGILVETDKDIGAGAITLVATMRATMDSPDAASTTNCTFAFNYTS
mgnify:CR=1 FL=1